MSSAEHSIVVNSSMQHLYDVLTDFAAYPDFLSSVKSVKITKQNKTQAEVEFVLSFVQEIGCVLAFNFESPNKLTWQLISADILLANSGEWELTELEDNLIDLTYRISVDFSIWVPAMLIDSMLQSTLPKMLAELKARAENC